jgi:hypothetical protein
MYHEREEKLGTGDFVCPRCEAHRTYSYMTRTTSTGILVRRIKTIDFVRCEACRTEFNTEILLHSDGPSGCAGMADQQGDMLFTDIAATEIRSRGEAAGFGNTVAVRVTPSQQTASECKIEFDYPYSDGSEWIGRSQGFIVLIEKEEEWMLKESIIDYRNGRFQFVPRPAMPCVPVPKAANTTKTITLEEQVAILAAIGLKLNEGITIGDLLLPFPREEYESRPFDLILFVLGIAVERSPWGRPVCSRVWNFDTECIDSTGDYVRIVKRLCEVAGRPDCLTDVEDFVDIHAGKAWLQYRVNGRECKWPLEVNDDWADTRTLCHVMKDIQHGGCRFFFKDNGQAMVLFYLNPDAAAQLNTLSNNALKPVLAE